MKKILAALTVTVIAAAAAVPALAGTKSVKVGNNYFVTPRNNATVTIQHGSTLKFVWHSNGVPHNVKKARGPGVPLARQDGRQLLAQVHPRRHLQAGVHDPHRDEADRQGPLGDSPQRLAAPAGGAASAQ